MIVASMSVAFAGTDTAHTIKVTTNGNGTHTYVLIRFSLVTWMRLALSSPTLIGVLL